MGQLDEQPENRVKINPQAADELLRAVTQDIENLRQNIVVHLSQDVERLQREKFNLIEDIEQLKTQRQQQLIQQQELVKQIAPALANQLQALVTDRLNQLNDSTPVSGKRAKKTSQDSFHNSDFSSTASDYNENANRLIASLDTTLRTTFKTLQQDLSSYQSSLSQQLSQMYSLEQQGEAILEALVSRLRQEFETESSSAIKPTSPAPPPSVHIPWHEYGRLEYPDEDSEFSVSYTAELAAPEMPLMPEPETPTPIPQLPPQPKSKTAAKLRIGFIFVLLSSLFLSLQNVLITIIFNKSRIFGQFEIGGFVAPSLGNSLLVLWLRMLVVVPLAAIFVTLLYPTVWRDIKQFLQSKDLPLFINVVASGFFLFLSQVLIYLALGLILPGVAIAIFFVYPIITVFLTWVLFGEQLQRFRLLLSFSVVVGFILLIIPGNAAIAGGGINAALGSAIAFAFYVILAQFPGRKIHPMPLSWINFVLILVFSSISLIAPLPQSWHPEVLPTMTSNLLISSLILGGTTIASYLFNNIGIKMIDALRGSVLGAIVPAFTALLALVVIQSTMQIEQIFGLLLVTLGVTALSFERWRRQGKAAQQTSRKQKVETR